MGLEVFLAHFGVGFAAKRATPRVSLAILFAAAQLADIVWPILVALGVEQVRIDPGNTVVTPLDFVSYPYSHSLLMLCIWGVALGLVYRSLSHRNGRTVVVLALVVVSHWVLDWISHRADMPLYPGGGKVGLGLWNSLPATVLVEFAIFAAGVWLYVRTTSARDRIGRWSLAAMVIFLAAVYALNLAGEPPPSVTAVWMAALIGGIVLLAWSWWTDRHRSPEPIAPAAPR